MASPLVIADARSELEVADMACLSVRADARSELEVAEDLAMRQGFVEQTPEYARRDTYYNTGESHASHYLTFEASVELIGA